MYNNFHGINRIYKADIYRNKSPQDGSRKRKGYTARMDISGGQGAPP